LIGRTSAATPASTAQRLAPPNDICVASVPPRTGSNANVPSSVILLPIGSAAVAPVIR